MATKKATKIVEFAADAHSVKCASLGRGNARMIATGGDDKKVNIFAVNKPNCILSLHGHTSPIECLKFRHDDGIIAAGSSSGMLKVWDLEQAKVIRTLTGHRAGLKSIEFHPFGDFVVSGGIDSIIKLYDIRQKGCIFNYKGHNGVVTCLVFSPDGKWILSGSEDSTIKIWDIQAGKEIKEIREQSGTVTSLNLHPQQILLASASSDRTVTFYDLDKFSPISTSPKLNSPCYAGAFHPTGSAYYAATDNSLRVFSWDPTSEQLDTCLASWSKPHDIGFTTSEQLIAVTASQNLASTWAVDIGNMQPLGGPPRPLTSSRSSFQDRPKTQCSAINQRRESPANEDEEVDDVSASVDIRNNEEYRQLFKAPQATPIAVPTPMPIKTPNVQPSVQPPSYHPPPSAAVGRQSSVDTSVNDLAREMNRLAQQQHNNQPHVGAGDANLAAEKRAQETTVLATISNSHSTVIDMLRNRNHQMTRVRNSWGSEGDAKAALATAISLNDRTVLVDTIDTLARKPTLWSLEMAVDALPQINNLISSKHEIHQVCACFALKMILKTFGTLIKVNLQAPPATGIVDISREERYNKCRECHQSLELIKTQVDKRACSGDKISKNFRDLSTMLSAIV